MAEKESLFLIKFSDKSNLLKLVLELEFETTQQLKTYRSGFVVMTPFQG
jgi:hypothetical protein